MRKNIKNFLVCILVTSAMTACVTDESLATASSENRDLTIIPSVGSDEGIDMELFNVVNLDYPGLERVREHYESGEYFLAAYYLLDYYRNRNTVFNPETDSFLMSPSVTASETNMADQALAENGYRFYVRNFSEGTDSSTGLDTYFSFMADDGSIDWEVNPEEVFIDGVVDQEWASQKHRHQWMLSQAKVYRTTKDETYIKSWIDVYSDWLETYPYSIGESVTSSDLPWYGLQAASRAIDQPSIMQCYIQSENFTPAWLSKFLVAFNKTVECIMTNPYPDPTHNIYLTQRQAIFYAAVLMPEFVAADTWLHESVSGINDLVSSEFNDDGVLVELDPSYHISAISDFYSIYLLAQGNDCLGLLAGDFVSHLRNAVEFVKDIVYPDYSIDNYNDTRSSSWTKRVLKRNFGYYLDMFPDNDAIRWLATERVRGTAPTDLVQKYTTSGYYMLRTGWTSDAMMLVLKNNHNPDNQWHCQPDNCTFTLYRNGRRFSPDAGCYTYNSGSDRNTYARANMHNTLTKTSGSIDNTLGEFLLHDTGNGYECVVTQNPHYSDLTHRRAVFLVDKSFYVIVDEGYGSYSGMLNLYFKGGNPDATTASRDSFVMDNIDKTGETGTFDASYPCGMHTEFSDNNNILFLTFPETSDGYNATWTTQYFSDTYEERTQRRVYTIELMKTADIAARFITVIYPLDAASEYENMDISASFTDNRDGIAGTFHDEGAKVSVTINDKTYNLLYTLN